MEQAKPGPSRLPSRAERQDTQFLLRCSKKPLG
jgi:hypothetical protein